MYKLRQVLQVDFESTCGRIIVSDLSTIRQGSLIINNLNDENGVF